MLEFKIKLINNPCFLLSLPVLMLLTGWLFLFPDPGFSKNLSKPVIIVNPGHGGHDHGAMGAEGTLEKQVTLILANLIIDTLQDNYQAVTTRNGDYFLNVPNRTAIANHNNASLFISIHAGGSYDYTTGGITISYLQATPDPVVFPPSPPAKNNANGYKNIPWDEIHSPQIPQSMEAGKCIQKRLSQNRLFPKSRLIHSPLRILSGADMPAVMIEIGYLSNPIEEKKIKDINYLTSLANEICKGIDDFYSKAENRINQ